MKKISKLKFLFISFALLMMSCQKEESLQKYYVDHQEEENFMHLDISTNMIFDNLGEISEEKREKLKSFKKINVLTLPINGENATQYQEEKEKVLSILKQEKYKKLIGLKYEKAKFLLFYSGKPEAIKEIIVMTYTDEKGFTLVRLLGKNLNADLLLETINSAKEGEINLNLEALESIVDELE